MTQKPLLTPALIATLAFSNFVVGMGAFVVVGTVEPVATGLGISAAQAGTLLSYYAFAYVVVSPVLVALTGRLPRRVVLAAGLSIFGLAALLGALAPGFSALAGSRILAAFGAAVLTPVTSAIAAMLAPPERRARTMSYVFLGLTLSQVIGVPAGSWIAYTHGWRAALAAVALLSLPGVFLLWRIVPRSLPFQPTSLVDLGRVLAAPSAMLATLFTASFMTSIFLLYTYFAPLLSTQMGFERDAITFTLFLFGLGAVIGNLMGGYLSDRIGAPRVLTGVTLAMIPFLIFFSFLPVPAWMHFTWTLAWASVGWSFGAAQQVR
ncbi:MAG: MFS transporter, partial [Pseudomonadota bacterium]